MKIDKIKTFTFKFIDNDENNGFIIYINGKKCNNKGIEMPLTEHQKIARTLSRIALNTYNQIDKFINKEKE